MASFKCTIEGSSKSSSEIKGAGTLKIDEKTNRYTLKIRSGLIRGKFQGVFSKASMDQSELLTLSPISDSRGKYMLTEGDLAFAEVKGTNFLEGLLYFTEEGGNAFALFVKGVFKRSFTESFSFMKNSRKSGKDAAQEDLFGCFSFGDEDISKA